MNRRRILAGQNLFLSLKLIFSQFDVVFSRTPDSMRVKVYKQNSEYRSI